MNKKIIATCQGADAISVNKFEEFQGKLKKITKANLEKLKKRIIRDGINVPLFVWRNDERCRILDGHQRLKALQNLKKDGYELPLIPVAYINAENEKDARQKLLGITSQFGEFEIEELDEWLGELDDDVADTLRFSNEELKIDFEKETEGDDDIPEDVKTINKTSDLWELGKHRVLCGDSTDEKQVKLLMNGKKADMVFTDPPYGLGGYGGRNKMELKGDDEDCTKFYKAIPILNEMYVWGYYFNYSMLNFEPRDVIVWKKNNFGLGKGYRGQYELCFYIGNFDGSDSDVWEINKDIKYSHPTQKPIELCVRAIKNSNPKSIIDLFLGSGSTLIACEKTNRICYGMEIDPHYCDIIAQRYRKWCQDNNKKYSIKLNGKIYNAN